MEKKTLIGIVVGVLVIIAVIIGLVVAANNQGKVVEPANQKLTKKEATYEITIAGVNVTPGKSFDKDSIAEEYEYSEIQSCAFDGQDHVYTYEHYEITCSYVDEKEEVYSVYFKDENVSTNEGIKITDTKSMMEQKYGTDYTEQEGKYIYTKGDVQLSFIVENDVITTIEYTLVLE